MSVLRACGVTVKWIPVFYYRKILQLIFDRDHVHCLTRGIMSTWNLRRFNPACKVVHMVAVQYQLEYLPIVFQIQFNTCQRPITRTLPSDDASTRVIRNSLTLLGNEYLSKNLTSHFTGGAQPFSHSIHFKRDQILSAIQIHPT